LSRQFQVDCVVPLHTAFVKARNARPELEWTADGVHPTSLGHTLIARTWLESVGLL
jgi:lysophospholipase L1-like esterase